MLARLLVEVIQSRIASLVIATSTLSEGINLPLETVLLSTLFRDQSPVPTREIANLIGRAGRPGYATEGRALVLLHALPFRYDRNRDRYDSLMSELSSRASNSFVATPRSALASLIEYLRLLWEQVPKGKFTPMLNNNAGYTSPACLQGVLSN